MFETTKKEEFETKKVKKWTCNPLQTLTLKKLPANI
jgi:hypothetical protein